MMLPSPARRSSPGRELRLENKHKRGCSLDCGPPLKKKEDDLALFTDMQMREKNNLLLSNEDFEDSLAKLKCSRDYPFGMSMHVRRGSNDLLNAESDKNDYDWLLTPPDTPLFPYLDDDEPPPSNLSTARGRQQSQPLHIRRSSMTEKSQKSSRSSASPHRLSPSPRSGGATVQSRGRSSSASQSSLGSVVRPTTPSKRSLTPTKSSNQNTRPSTPTPRRMSVDSNLQTSSSGRRGNSPMKGSRGGSASPKLQGWQLNIPGFAPDAPPNLRTSLDDRIPSYTRGSSPASRNGRDLSSRISRHSMSPTASRSASSSQSYDPDRSSPHSKDSTTSYLDEDLESLPSVSMGASASPITRRNGVFARNKSVGFSKKPSRTLSTNSNPKCSLDSTIQQMDQHKTPQNMFRPLLSSVPISSFYIGKANAMHRPVFSRNSSLTTSSNASSELGASIALEVADRDTVNHAGEWGRMSDSLLQEEGFVFEKMDEIKEDIMHDLISVKSVSGYKNFNVNISKDIAIDEISRPSSIAKTALHPLLTDSSNHLECSEQILCERTCIVCGKIFYVVESTDSIYNVCEECSEKSELPVLSRNDALVYQEEDSHPTSKLDNHSFDKIQLMTDAPDVSEETSHMDVSCQLDDHDELVDQLDRDPEKCTGFLKENSIGLITDEKMCHDQLPEVQELLGAKDQESSLFQLPTWEKKQFHPEMETKTSVNLLNHTYKSLQQQPSEASSSPKVESSEATGISMLLQRTNSIKGPLVQTRVFTASSLHCEEPSYARENANVINKIIFGNSTSASSVDMGMSMQTEDHAQRQLSARRSAYDNVTTVSDVMFHGQDLYPRTSVRTGENPGCDSLAYKKEGNNESASFLQPDSIETSDAHVPLDEAARYFSQAGVSFVRDSSQTTSSGKPDDLFESFTVTEGADQIDWPMTMLHTDKGLLHHDDAEVDKSRCSSVHRDEHTDSSFHAVCNDEDSFDGTLRNSSTTSTDTPTYANTECIKLENNDNKYSDIDTELPHSQSLSSMSGKELSAYAQDCEDDTAAADESGVIIKDLPKQRPERPGSPNPTEATDAVLFCSSIIHDLAYKAATIGVEKETSKSQFLLPTSTVLNRPVPYQKEETRVLTRRATNSKRVKRDAPETEAKVQETEPPKEKACDSPKSNPISPCKVETPKSPSKCNCAIM